MKFEFKEGNFSAEMNSELKNPQDDVRLFPQGIFKGGTVFMLGCASIVTAIINLIFGLVIGLTTKTLDKVLGEIPWHITTVMIILSAVLVFTSVACGIISVIEYSKSARAAKDGIGFALSLTAFVLCLFGLIINILTVFV